MISANKSSKVTTATPTATSGRHIADYLGALKEDVFHHYQWPLPTELVEEHGLEGSPFKQTTQLKELLSVELDQASNDEARCEIAGVWIKQWGQIRQLKTANIRRIVTDWTPLAGRPQPEKQRFPFERISSWSKYLALICPSWAAIYDSRVAYSINAIHFMAGAPMKILPSPPSENRTLGLLDASSLLLAARLKGRRDLSTDSIKRDFVVRRTQAYATYLEWLTSAHGLLWREPQPLAHTEMLLFALADTRIFQDLAAHCARST